MRALPRFTKTIFGLVGMTSAVLVLGFLLFAAIATRDIPSSPPKADGIVVLTGGQMRIAEAGRLLENGHGRRLLVSGVNKITTKNDVRRLSRVRPDMFQCCVDLGYGAKNTRGNATETRAWAQSHGFESLIVVTASYHMPRSMAELASEMPRVRLIAHPVMPVRFRNDPWWLNSAYARILAAEYIKFLPTVARYGITRISQANYGGENDPVSKHAAGRAK